MSGGSRAEFRDQLTRTADWLAAMPLDRLEREESQRSLLSDIHAICVRMVELQCHIDPLAYPGHSKPALPSLKSAAAGSQLRVIGTELLETLVTEASNVVSGGELDELTDQLRVLRVKLPNG